MTCLITYDSEGRAVFHRCVIELLLEIIKELADHVDERGVERGEG